jgi:hypothetical protein
MGNGFVIKYKQSKVAGGWFIPNLPCSFCGLSPFFGISFFANWF